VDADGFQLQGKTQSAWRGEISDMPVSVALLADKPASSSRPCASRSRMWTSPDLQAPIAALSRH
jgi:hypothetical protein